MPVLRGDAAGGGESAGLREGGGVFWVHGEGVRVGDIPESGAAEEPAGGPVRGRGAGEEAIPEGVDGREAFGEGVRDSAEAQGGEAGVLQPGGEPVRGGELLSGGSGPEGGGELSVRIDGGSAVGG